MSRTDPETGEIQTIPLFHMPNSTSWHMAAVVAESIIDAQEAGEAIELVYPMLTSNVIMRALAFDRHSSRIMQVCGGLLHIHYDDDQFLINVDYINVQRDEF
jgi:hypothetical protein